MGMNRELYPKNWKEISLRIRERDGQKCKECGVRNGAYGCRDQDGNFYTEGEIDRNGVAPGTILGKVIKIVLTVAHLDHDSTNNADSNLAALCQRCHLRLDIDQHKANSAKTRHLKKVAAGQIELFV
jgi:5-methylcytosine-specific restriction endonuclease McrA